MTKTKTSKNGLKTGLKTKTGLKDYTTGSNRVTLRHKQDYATDCLVITQ